jgi:hypothetical protein
VEFVEAQERRLGRDLFRHRPDRIAFFSASRMDAVMDLEHEGVEMDAPFARCRDRGKEHVHQHGLAATDIAVDIKSARRRAGEPGPPAACAVALVLPEAAPQHLQFFRRGFLRRIGHQLARIDARAIKRFGAGHDGEGPRKLWGMSRRFRGGRRHGQGCHSEFRVAMQNRG